jgi:collagen type I/II/III/V/XI/XXIV/XXVII alpha
MSLTLSEINTPDSGSAGSSPGTPGSNGGSGGAADEVFNNGTFTGTGPGEIAFQPQANGGLAAGGNSGSGGIPGSSSGNGPVTWSPGTNGGNAGNGGNGGEASITLGTISVGTSAAPATNGVEINATAAGGQGILASGGGGGGGGSSGINSPGTIGGQPGNGGNGGNGGTGGNATIVVTDFVSFDSGSAGTDIFTSATGTSGGNGFAGASGGQGGAPSNGGVGGNGGDGGSGIDSFTSSTVVDNTAIFLQSTVSGGPGQGGGTGGAAGAGITETAPPLETFIYGVNGPGGNGGSGGDATAMMSADTLTAPSINLKFSVDAGPIAVGGTSPAEASMNNSFEFTNGAPAGASGVAGTEGSGSIVFTNNIVTIGEGMNGSIPFNNHGVLDLSMSILNLGSVNNNVTQNLNGALGGNLTFSGNSFVGQGSSTLDLQLAGTGSVIIDTAADTLSIAGSPSDNAIGGFSTFDLDNNNTVIAGATSITLNFASDPDTLVFTPNSGDVTINGASDTNMLLEFKGFGAGLTASDLAADTTQSSGNTFITIGGSTIELTGFTGAIPSNEESIQCFRRGTRLATPLGWARVEDLSAGDLVLTHDGEAVAVVWLGHRRVDCARHPVPARVSPVRIAAGAFAAGVPERDVFLSPDHAVFARGMLFPVKYLINGDTIAQVAAGEVDWFHVEVEGHAVLLAEGLPAESYLDTGERGWFGGVNETVVRHPAWERGSTDAALAWETRAAAPLCVSGPVLARVREDLAGRVGLGRVVVVVS